LVFISAALLALGLIGIQIRPFVNFGLNLIAPLPLIRRVQPWLVSFYESSYKIFKLRHIIPTTGMGMVASLGDVAGFVIILAGFGIEVNGLLFLQALVIVCLSAAIGALSGVPNGAGVTEISVSAMLMLIIAPGNPLMTPAVAATAAFIEGFFHKWFRVLIGLGVAMIFRKRLFGVDVEKAIDELAIEHRQKQSDYSINVSV
jgi:uncharacterized membrane protein YbhN (UPF0104 family)